MTEFFENLMIWTGGILCAAFWIMVFAIIAIEAFDLVFGRDQEEES